MYDTRELLSRLSLSRQSRDYVADAGDVTLADFIPYSLAEISRHYHEELSWGESRHLYREAQQLKKDNQLLEARIFTAANPQLRQAISVGIQQQAGTRSYDELFGQRSNRFVNPGSVASMFSPAGYLTELYREAKGLHFASSAFNLDKRRPDLKDLLLSQKNMDEEVSTLSLSNEILMKHVEKKTGKIGDDLLQHFSRERVSAGTPYHQPYESIRNAVLALDSQLEALSDNPAVMQAADPASLLAIVGNFPPELHTILMENITEENAKDLYKKNFSVPVEHFSEPGAIAKYYNLSAEEAAIYNPAVLYQLGPNSVYQDNQLVYTLETAEGKYEKYHITMTPPPGFGYHYLELIPLGELRFEVRFSVKVTYENYSTFSIRAFKSKILLNEENFLPLAHTHYRREITLTPELVNKPLTLDCWRHHYSKFSAYQESAQFSIEKNTGTLLTEADLLKLNKLIRLGRATGLAPLELKSLIRSLRPEEAISPEVLSSLFYTLYFKRRYGISVEEAGVLSGSTLGQQALDGQVSHFDRLFNTPLLGGQSFVADGSAISIDPADATGSHARDALLRGLDITGGELHQLSNIAKLVDGKHKLVLSLDNISLLWRLAKIARLEGLTVNDLALLFSVSPFPTANLPTFLPWVYQTAKWLKTAGMAPVTLWLLATNTFGESLTPEMSNLRTLLAERLTPQSIEAEENDSVLLTLAAPVVSGAFSLASPELARSLLQWYVGSTPVENKTLRTFLTLAVQAKLNKEQEKQLACFFHALAQLALTVRTLSLSEAEVATLAQSGTKLLQVRSGSAQVQSLYHFHRWINGLGGQGSAILAALGEENLSWSKIAEAMNIDGTLLAQAAACAGIEDKPASWSNVDQALQWLDVSTRLNTMPAMIKELVDICYSGSQLPSWAQWKQLASGFEAALTVRQAEMLAQTAAERLSEVLSSWFVGNIEVDGLMINSRDDLYSYFLIDNQVSGKINTTRLAEATAGIQLYVNRALNRIEPGAVADVSTRQFFKDWELNSRYATWGGVSRLVYYPENYVDPLQRVGQTKMMEEMLQAINQSQLGQDSVEEAFKTYLARFETVADLKVISAYHDNVNSDSGLTWFVGRGREAQYWWRNVDMSRMNDGKLAANAWSEWVRIDAPVNAWQDTVRPVVFRDRLYLTWLERDEVASNGTSRPTVSWRYTLKLMFLRQDGTWSAPWQYDVTTQVNATGVSGETAPRLAASGYQEEDTLMVFIYSLKDKYTFAEADKIQGVSIYADGSHIIQNNTQMSRYSALATTLDTKADDKAKIIHRANYRFAVDYDVPTSLAMGSATGAYALTTLSGNTLRIRSQYSSKNLNITLQNPALTVKYESTQQLRQKQTKVMGLIGLDGNTQYGHKFVIAQSSQYVKSLHPDLGGPVCVYNETKGYIGSTQTGLERGAFRELILSKDIGTLSDYDQAWFKRNFNNYNGNGNALDVLFNAGTGKAAEFKACRYASDGKPFGMFHRFSTYETRNWLDIDTFLDAGSVTVTTKAGNAVKYWSAKDWVDAASLPKGNLDGMTYAFRELEIDGSTLQFVNNRAPLEITFEAKSKDGRSLGKVSNTLGINKVDFTPATILQLRETVDGAQYIQSGVHRIRVNTLFARELVSRASTGIDALLSMETQLLQEPQRGKGCYVDFTLPPYKSAIHGSSRAFKLNLKHVFDNNPRSTHSGMLADTPVTVRLFVPLDDKPLNGEYIAKVFLTTEKIKEASWGWSGPHFIYGADGKTVTINSNSNTSMFDAVTILHDQHSEPMDFNGANALYFWEMFYYVPMMCFRRLLQEKKFAEARKWLSYVWDPNGYIVNGKIAPWRWNCRPLEETTSWNSSPLDAVDPDAVAQNDPTHYKVATFMGYIEMLMTRGDMCYRELTRDSLNEAKMWYLHALEVMGEEPGDMGSTTWITPSLNSAASQTGRIQYHRALTEVESGETGPALYTANSLTGLFLPEYNPALKQCWGTLRQRMFNLRHHLSIDGQPLSLAIYAEPADPKAIQASMVQASQGGGSLPAGTLSLYRFPVMLERARNLAGQLAQFGASILNLAERSDGEQLSTLLLQQGMALSQQSIDLQKKTLEELDSEKKELLETRSGAQGRLDKYSALYEENVSAQENHVLNMESSAIALATAGAGLHMVGGALDMAPNTFGLACGGSRWGALANAGGVANGIASGILTLGAQRTSTSEAYRRRRQEWEIQRDNAQSEVKQINIRLDGLAIRREAAQKQVESLETQYGHTQAQLELMQRKFTSQALYSWMRGKLSAIYYQFFDITQSFCLLAQESLRRELNDNGLTFIRGSAWNGSTAGLMAGETLQLSLAEMEKAWTERDERALEVTRTVSLAQVYDGLKDGKFSLAEALLNNTQASGNKTFGGNGNEVKLNADKELQASVKLSDLNIAGDYKASLGKTRRIKQVSVTLPALVGPYQDVRAVLNYGGSVQMPKGCSAIAVSHGMNDSGQFTLDFNDARYLPFEGIPVDDGGTLTLSFPDAQNRQAALLASLSDIILHIRYTINS